MTADIRERMRADWNQRAREDARFYSAYARRQQDEAEFLASGLDLAHRELEPVLPLLPAASSPRARRALEIGCGPGRLLHALSGHFGEIHGVDVSDEMVRLARESLTAIPHAHVTRNDGTALAAFADESVDFVFSHAMFSHLPMLEIAIRYFDEVRRVLKPYGVFRCQLNGLGREAAEGSTWEGVPIPADVVRSFTRAYDFELLALEGATGRQMWTTWRKLPTGGVAHAAAQDASRSSVARITNAITGEPVAPRRGRLAAVTLWAEGLPAGTDLNALSVRFGASSQYPCALGEVNALGLQPVKVMLPSDVPTGLVPVQLHWHNHPAGPVRYLRVVPAGPAVPRILSIADSRQLAPPRRILSRSVRVVAEELAAPDLFEARIDGQPVVNLGVLCADPLLPRFEFTFGLPDQIAPGAHYLQMQMGQRRFAPVALHIAQ